MATGKRAFPDKQPSLVIDAILHYDPVRPTLLNPEVSQESGKSVILKALDRDPELRYQSAREVRADWDAYKLEVTSPSTCSGRFRARGRAEASTSRTTLALDYRGAGGIAGACGCRRYVLWRKPP